MIITSIAVGSEGRFIFSADGRRLLVAMQSGVIEQHALDISDLYEGAAARLDRGFNIQTSGRSPAVVSRAIADGSGDSSPNPPRYGASVGDPIGVRSAMG
jgi:hypothetical protein